MMKIRIYKSGKNKNTENNLKFVNKRLASPLTKAQLIAMSSLHSLPLVTMRMSSTIFLSLSLSLFASSLSLTRSFTSSFSFLYRFSFFSFSLKFTLVVSTLIQESTTAFVCSMKQGCVI